MRKELNYFMIEGSYGSNQDWFSNFLMKMGGCAAVTACDSCIYFAREFGKKELYPDDSANLTKDAFVSFGMKMKPYLKPRVGGVSKLSMYEEGFGRYLGEIGSSIAVNGFSGEQSYEEAKEFVKKQIDNQILIPYLLLKHQDARFKDLVWHWFVLTGYDDTESDFKVKIATYSAGTHVSLKELWNTGFEQKGGMIEFLL